MQTHVMEGLTRMISFILGIIIGGWFGAAAITMFWRD
jgi:hypothetical protein